MRQATLRGQLNLQKRYGFAAACYNLSQLLRQKFGCGTLKMAQAIPWAHFPQLWLALGSLRLPMLVQNCLQRLFIPLYFSGLFGYQIFPSPRSSTAC